MKTERTLLVLINMLLIVAGALIAHGATAQTVPTVINPDPVFWYNQYQAEHTRAEGLERAGSTAIKGLSDSLASANSRIVLLGGSVQAETKRAATAEAALIPVTKERDRLKGKTWAGKGLRKIRNGLAIGGGLKVAYEILKLLL